MADRKTLVAYRKVRAARVLAHVAVFGCYAALPPLIFLNSRLPFGTLLYAWVIWFGVASLGSPLFHGVAGHVVDRYRDRLLDRLSDQRRAGLCPNCGYDRGGLDDRACPECGSLPGR